MSADNERDGARLKSARTDRGLVVADLAKMFRDSALAGSTWRPPKLKYIERTIRAHESGGGVGPRYRALWATALDTTEDSLFGPDATPVITGRNLGLLVVPPHARDNDDVERRTVLQLAALGIGAGTLGSTGEPVRQLLALGLNSEPRDLEDWQLTCADHLHAIRTRAPAEARDGILVDLLAVHRQLQSADAVAAIELQRVSAGLSTLHANALTRLGEHGAAIHWWRTAKAAADASGDLDLRLLVRSAEAGFGLYGQRDPATVLQLTVKAHRIAGERESLGAVEIGIAQAKALSMLGRHEEARATLRKYTTRPPPDRAAALIPTYWTDDKVHFAESWVSAHCGDEPAADDARVRVLSQDFVDYQYAANVRLHEALCTVVNGGTDTGATLAAAILSDLPPSQHSQMITETGRTVLRAVPYEERGLPAVQALQALTSDQGGKALDR